MGSRPKVQRLAFAVLGVAAAGAACLRESRSGATPPPEPAPRAGKDSDRFRLPTIYTLDAEGPIEQFGFLDTPPGENAAALFSCRADGTHVRRITFAPSGVSDPRVLPDGRLLLRMNRATESPSRSDWFTLHTDGTELAAARPEDIRAAMQRANAGDDHREPRGSSSVVRDELATGQLYCLDSRISDEALTGAIHRVRVIAVKPAAAAGTQASIEPEVLGETAVEADGSFFLELPARTPFRLATLDERGAVLRTMNTWMWLMPGERRGCIGCHEDRERTPPNRHVLALRKPPARVGLGSLSSLDGGETGGEGP